MSTSCAICDLLHDDHMATVQLFERLEASLIRRGRKAIPDANDPDTAGLLAAIASAMRVEVTSHFDFEEAELFSRVAMFGDPPMLAILQVEHGTIRPLAIRLADLADAARADGFIAESWGEFHDLGQELSERIVFHIQKEEMGFLPLIAQIVGPEDDKALSEAYARIKSAA